MFIAELFEKSPQGLLEVKSSNPHLYLDMDGVQANFFTAWARWHAKKFNQPQVLRYKDIGDRVAREQSIKDLNSQGPEFVYDFFSNLPPLPGGQRLIKWLKSNHVDFTVLSAPLKGNEQASIDGKRVWLDRFNPGTSSNAIFTSEKYQFAQRDGRPNILVDDFKKYLGDWREAGGVPILYRDDQVNRVIEQLSRIYQTAGGSKES